MASIHRFSPLPPEAYWEPRHSTLELTTILSRGWAFAGFLDQLARPNDYVTLRVAGQSIVVQNFDGELRALHNVCSHRHAIIKGQLCGNGPLRCSYHGWTYNADGTPVGVPGNRENFGFAEVEKARWGLRRFAVETIGAFVFVRIANDGPDLRASFGPLAELFEALGSTFSVPFRDEAQDWACNWKIAVENTLEAYHVPFAHRESLGMMIEPEGTFSFYGPHSTARHKMLEKSVAWWEKALRRARLTRSGAYSDYQHILVYPNTCIGLTYGSLLSIQTIEPTGPESCRLRYRLLLPRSEAGPEEATEFRTILQDHLGEFNRQVLEEDRGPVEWCQAGCREAKTPTCFGVNEERVAAFANAVATDLGGESRSSS